MERETETGLDGGEWRGVQDADIVAHGVASWTWTKLDVGNARLELCLWACFGQAVLPAFTGLL